MAANNDPIWSKTGSVNGNCTLTTAANDYTGQSVNNQLVFAANATNGGFLQKIRLKALGTNVATVVRFYLTQVNDNLATVISAPAGTPTGSAGTSGTMTVGTYYAKIYAVDAYGKVSAAATETSGVTTSGAGTSSIAWSWTASSGAASYIITVGQVAGGERQYFTSNTNSYTQTTNYTAGSFPFTTTIGNMFYGEISLPATTASATVATPDMDYVFGFALPAGTLVYAGLGTTVSAGWMLTAIGGSY